MESSSTFEANGVKNKKIWVDAFLFNKKKMFMHKKLRSCKIDGEKESLLKSYMVIFVINNNYKRDFLCELEAFCRQYKNYGPIVNMSGNELIYFPQLSYQDGLLLKSIFENRLGNEHFEVLFGSVIV